MIRAIDLTGVAFHHEPEDVDTLKRLVGMLPKNPVAVNIGACFGTSALALLEAREGIFVFSVDIKPCEAEREHLAQSGVDPARCVRVLGRSQDVGRYWPRKVDMVFVDGSHFGPAVEEDIVVWRAKIKSGGVIAFDDYYKPICPDVGPTVDKCMVGKYELILHVGDIVAFRV